MAKQTEMRYSIPAVERFINWLINTIFYYRLLFVAGALYALGHITFRVWQASPEIDKYKNIALVFSFGSIVIGIFYTILNYEYNQIKYRSDKRTAIISLSFNATSEWHRPTMVENLKICKQLYDKHKNLIDDNKAVDFFNILESDEQARSALVSILNYFECMSLGVIHGVLDEKFIKDYFKTVYRVYIANYGFYIEHRRNIHNSPLAWVNYTSLAEKWRQEG